MINCQARGISTNKVFCVLCYLFSSKTQDVHTDYFACISVRVITVQLLLSKERVEFLRFFFSFSDPASGLYFSYGIVFLACLLVEMNESEVTLHRHTKITVIQQQQQQLQY